jgi:hypothetical protein
MNLGYYHCSREFGDVLIGMLSIRHLVEGTLFHAIATVAQAAQCSLIPY